MIDKRKAEELLEQRRFGTLSTHSLKVPGYPHGSVVNYALDGAGNPLFLFSRLALHTKNLEADRRASLLVYGSEAEENPLTAARLTVFGDVAAVEDEEAAQAAYLAKHPDAAEYIEFGDFAIYRLTAARMYFVGGFGEMGWI
jgi:putative heme iron utilization protein